jgi:hypothetical protein
LLHDVCPEGHAHAPALQFAPTPHWFPQAPQSKGSVVVSTHAPLHAVRPAAHVVVQAPFEQTWSVAQRALQPPQLRGSLPVSVQTPRQRVPPA